MSLGFLTYTMGVVIVKLATQASLVPGREQTLASWFFTVMGPRSPDMGRGCSRGS